MTRDELADKFCESCVELQRAELKRIACEKLNSESELEKRRCHATLEALIKQSASRTALAQASAPATVAKASSESAVAFAVAVGKWRTAEVMLQKAVASVEALKQESKDALELLISACQEAG